MTCTRKDSQTFPMNRLKGEFDGVVTFRDYNLAPISEPIPFSTHSSGASWPSSYSSTVIPSHIADLEIPPSPMTPTAESSTDALHPDVDSHIESCVPIAFAPQACIVPA